MSESVILCEGFHDRAFWVGRTAGMAEWRVVPGTI